LEEKVGVYVVVNDDNFDKEVLKSNIPVLVDFWAEWCAPCKVIGPMVEQLAQDYAGKLKVAKMDVDQNPQSSMNYGIRSIPTLLFFKDGKAVDQILGAVQKTQIEEKITSLV
jgi:thioredoxin 1